MSDKDRRPTLEETQADFELLLRKSLHGCGNHSCVIKKPRGMGTNGPCRCRPRDFTRDLLSIAERLDDYGHAYQWKREGEE